MRTLPGVGPGQVGGRHRSVRLSALPVTPEDGVPVAVLLHVLVPAAELRIEGDLLGGLHLGQASTVRLVRAGLQPGHLEARGAVRGDVRQADGMERHFV